MINNDSFILMLMETAIRYESKINTDRQGEPGGGMKGEGD